MLDDYFSSAEFLSSGDNGFTFDGKGWLTNDSGIGLNYMSAEANSNNNSGNCVPLTVEDDEVFSEKSSNLILLSIFVVI